MITFHPTSLSCSCDPQESAFEDDFYMEIVLSTEMVFKSLFLDVLYELDFHLHLWNLDVC